VLEDGDLLVCFLGAGDGQPPRAGIWRGEAERCPIELDALTPAARRTLGAMSLPVELDARTSITSRSEREVIDAVSHPFLTGASLLDARGVEKTARSRGRQSVEVELHQRGLSAGDYFTMSPAGVYSAPRVKADIVEVVRAVHEPDWESARRVLAVASTPLWRDGPPAPTDVGALKLAPETVTDPTARSLIEQAIHAAATRAPATPTSTGSEPAGVDRTDLAEEPQHAGRAGGGARVGSRRERQCLGLSVWLRWSRWSSCSRVAATAGRRSRSVARASCCASTTA
jgi:hypothetical protein